PFFERRCTAHGPRPALAPSPRLPESQERFPSEEYLAQKSESCVHNVAHSAERASHEDLARPACPRHLCLCPVRRRAKSRCSRTPTEPAKDKGARGSDCHAPAGRAGRSSCTDRGFHRRRTARAWGTGLAKRVDLR